MKMNVDDDEANKTRNGSNSNRKISFLGDKLFPSILSTRYLASGLHSIPALPKEGGLLTNKNPIYVPII